MLVMVYGTLMKGFCNHSIIENSLFVKRAEAKGDLYHLLQGYPALIEGSSSVKGEVYDVDDETLREMDIMEDYQGPGKNNLYNRVKSDVVLEDGTAAKVYIYIYAYPQEAKEGGTFIEDGDWRKFMEGSTKLY